MVNPSNRLTPPARASPSSIANRMDAFSRSEGRPDARPSSCASRTASPSSGQGWTSATPRPTRISAPRRGLPIPKPTRARGFSSYFQKRIGSLIGAARPARGGIQTPSTGRRTFRGSDSAPSPRDGAPESPGEARGEAPGAEETAQGSDSANRSAPAEETEPERKT